ARDVAMNVALPEIDGRVLTRAISFKAQATYDAATQTSLVRHAPDAEGIAFTSQLVARWARLRRTDVAARRVAVVLSNYPSSDGQIANGVGLDTPAGTLRVLRAMRDVGYDVAEIPDSGDIATDGAALIRRLQGEENPNARAAWHVLPLAAYEAALSDLPEALRLEIATRWGAPEADPMFDVAAGGFRVPIVSLGSAVVGVQPGRGAGLDAKDAHHDQTIVPPHGYVAFYAFLRHQFDAHAVIHMGKHGNLEWMPGKAMALSPECYPQALFGPLPHVYPFIVNDPGEGTQAKRRTSAVIIDHMTPPLTRAESYGPLRDLEALVDEYYEAAGVDPRRTRLLGARILDLAATSGVARDCGIEAGACEDESLGKLDNFLCDLKELQIRNGLHVFGESPSGARLADLLVALVRLPRGDGTGGQASLLRALSDDLGLGPFDPLTAEMTVPWDGPRPPALIEMSDELWRTAGDTVERLEFLAVRLVEGRASCASDWLATHDVLAALACDVRPRVSDCGPREIQATLDALDGRFVVPGPSGAPTRGRLDVLPTGRNFFSLDGRTVPSEAAWTLGSRSAEQVVTAYRQEHGDWPRQVALSAWGTSNMRTGGDDIAQALAFIGVRPTWDTTSRRVTGYEIVPLSELQRPRVDVMFRISGFFRDAFPSQIALLDSAFRAVMDLDEPESANPLAARQRADCAELVRDGEDAETAQGLSRSRIFGSKPGTYGAGLKDLVQTGAWQSAQDLAAAYLSTGGFAYGVAEEGAAQHAQFERRVGASDAIVQNQDAREFDILDSADFYQFEGGLATAAAHVSGAMPRIYHNDHSRPERPVVRTLEDEMALTVRGRAANPKWIAAMRSHGYKGGSEMAATVTNLFGFAATTQAVAGHHFEVLFDSYLVDEETSDFLEEFNPAARREMAARFLEAIERGFWQPRRNSAWSWLTALTEETGDGGQTDGGHSAGRRGGKRAAQGEDAQAQGAA
ncbi:MAG: cobaltochelatase subunit CobN, partial [Pseudomonadota bacterium]